MSDPLDVVRRFQDAWDAHDLDATLALVTHDCVFESARPGAMGARVVGRDALRAAWAPSFASAAAPGGGAFVVEDLFACGDRVVQLWRYEYADQVVRGVDVMRVRDGLVAEKFGYVKV
jgi:ketosteroid isomerase-like protein